MSKLIDSLQNVVASGDDNYIIGLHRILLAYPEDVSEDDKVTYKNELETIRWTGSLTVILDE